MWGFCSIQAVLTTLIIFHLNTRLAVGSNEKEIFTIGRSLIENNNPNICKINSPELDCNKINVACLRCIYKENCVYGNTTSGNCSVPQGIICKVIS